MIPRRPVRQHYVRLSVVRYRRQRDTSDDDTPHNFSLDAKSLEAFHTIESSLLPGHHSAALGESQDLALRLMTAAVTFLLFTGLFGASKQQHPRRDVTTREHETRIARTIQLREARAEVETGRRQEI